MIEYVVRLIPEENGGVVAAFPDVPEAESRGADEDAAMAGAKKALEAALATYVADGRPLPMPTDTCCAPKVSTSRFSLVGFEA